MWCFVAGAIAVLLPSAIVFALMIWRAPTMREEDEIPDHWRGDE